MCMYMYMYSTIQFCVYCILPSTCTCTCSSIVGTRQHKATTLEDSSKIEKLPLQYLYIIHVYPTMACTHSTVYMYMICEHVLFCCLSYHSVLHPPPSSLTVLHRHTVLGVSLTAGCSPVSQTGTCRPCGVTTSMCHR